MGRARTICAKRRAPSSTRPCLQVGAGEREGQLQVPRLRGPHLLQLVERLLRLPGERERLREQAAGGHVLRALLPEARQDRDGLGRPAELQVRDGQGQQREAIVHGGGRCPQERLSGFGHPAVDPVQDPDQQPALGQSGAVVALGDLDLAAAQAGVCGRDRAVEGRHGTDIAGGRPGSRSGSSGSEGVRQDTAQQQGARANGRAGHASHSPSSGRDLTAADPGAPGPGSMPGLRLEPTRASSWNEVWLPAGTTPASSGIEGGDRPAVNARCRASVAWSWA